MTPNLAPLPAVLSPGIRNCMRTQMQQMHSGCTPRPVTPIFARDVPIPTSRARLHLLALDPRRCARPTRMAHPPSVWGLASDPLPLLARGVGAVICSMPLEQVGTRKRLVALRTEEALAESMRLNMSSQMLRTGVPTLAVCALVERGGAAMATRRSMC